MPDLSNMGFDELWSLHEELTKVLAQRIMAERLQLEHRLSLLNLPAELSFAVANPMAPADEDTDRKPRKVPPKYRNSSPPYETWSGRGKRPRWLSSALQSGADIEDFRITEDAEKP